MAKLKKHQYQIYSPELKMGVLFDNSNYVVNTVDLGNIEANLSFYAGAGQYGKTITNRVLGPRDVFISGYIITDNDGEMELLKHRLESVILPTTDFELIVDGNYKLTLSAYETLQYSASWFENNQIICKFSIDAVACNPFFETLGPTSAEITSWIKDFHLPKTFTNEERFTFGHRNPNKVCVVRNQGDVPTGILISFQAVNGTVVNPWLQNELTKEFIQIDTTIQNGEEVLINTGYAKKSITNITTGQNLMANMTLDSHFIQIPRGKSSFTFGMDEGSSGTLQCVITYVPQLVVV